MKQPQGLYESPTVWDRDLTMGQRNLFFALRDFWPPGAGSALDVGCGDGKISRAIAEHTGVSVFGLDFSQVALSRTGIPCVQADAGNMPFVSKSFDLVLATDLLEHLPKAKEIKALNEIFRAARKWVILAVPYDEELLDGTARCMNCGSIYHVNWHQRRYVLSTFFGRLPQQWHLDAIVLSGEPWSSFSPVEIRFRRELLNQWSGWEEAICPHCGHPGHQADPIKPLPELTAAALAPLVYDHIKKAPRLYTHSEMLLLIAAEGHGFSMPRLLAPGPIIPAGKLKISGNRPETDLLPYPQFSRFVTTDEGEIVAQFPTVGSDSTILMSWPDGDDRDISMTIEDGCGLVWSGSFSKPPGSEFRFSLPRKTVAGYYGIIVRIRPESALPEILDLDSDCASFEFLEPTNSEQPEYRRVDSSNIPIYLQITGQVRLNPQVFTEGANTTATLKTNGWAKLFEKAEKYLNTRLSLIGAERDQAAAECARVTAERDQEAAECNRVTAERDQIVVYQNRIESRFEVRIGAFLRKRLGWLFK